MMPQGGIDSLPCLCELLGRLPHMTRSIQVSALLLGFAASVSAGTVFFDELPSQPVDGVTIPGLTFNFEVGGSSSSDATYNFDTGLGATTYLSDPVLEGDARGILTLIFAKPTTELSFGLGLLGFANLTPGAVMDLYDDRDLLLQSISIDTVGDPTRFINEGWLSWADPQTGVSRAVIDFDDAAGRFALDNLTFSGNSVPEGGCTLLLLASALFSLAVTRRPIKATWFGRNSLRADSGSLAASI